jgi:hypothetical protein
VERARKRHQIAGAMLKDLAALEWLEKRGSFRKILYLMEEHYRRALYVDGEKVRFSEPTLRRIRDAAMPAAHLWAALCTIIGKGGPPLDEKISALHPNLLVISPSHVPALLALGEYYRRFGEGFRMTRTETLLAAGETWKVPSGYPVPEVTIRHVLPAWAEDRLSAYAKSYLP